MAEKVVKGAECESALAVIRMSRRTLSLEHKLMTTGAAVSRVR